MADYGDLIPADELPEDAAASLAQYAASLDDPRLFGSGAVDDVTITTAPDTFRVGRSWAFDFDSREFVLAPNGLSPLSIAGTATLRQWVQKALLTERGSCAIHADAYGIEAPFEPISGPLASAVREEWVSRIRDTLLVHPKIRDVVDFAWQPETADGEGVGVTFRCVLDDESVLSVTDFQVV